MPLKRLLIQLINQTDSCLIFAGMGYLQQSQEKLSHFGTGLSFDSNAESLSLWQAHPPWQGTGLPKMASGGSVPPCHGSSHVHTPAPAPWPHSRAAPSGGKEQGGTPPSAAGSQPKTRLGGGKLLDRWPEMTTVLIQPGYKRGPARHPLRESWFSTEQWACGQRLSLWVETSPMEGRFPRLRALAPFQWAIISSGYPWASPRPPWVSDTVSWVPLRESFPTVSECVDTLDQHSCLLLCSDSMSNWYTKPFV